MAYENIDHVSLLNETLKFISTLAPLEKHAYDWFLNLDAYMPIVWDGPGCVQIWRPEMV